MPLIDSHCHLDFAAFDADRAALWQQCQSSGLEALIIPGVSPAQWPKAAQLCEELPGLHWAAGLHPWWVSGTQISPDELGEQLARQLHHQHCVAIGECGLDALIDCALEDQQRFLEVQLQLACEHHRPLILHVRKAHPQLQALLRYYRPPAGGVVHGFSGSRELGESYWKLGFHLGIGGTISYPRASKTRQAVAELPLEALLLETDAPDMPLQGFQGEANSPLRLTDVAAILAELRGESVATIADQTNLNTRRLFGF